MEKQKLVPMARSGYGKKGKPIRLLSNHFRVNVNNVEGHFIHYSVNISYDDGTPVEVKGIGRKVIEKVKETYVSELDGKDFAYDGEKSLFTIGSLPNNKLEFVVLLEDVVSGRTNANQSPDNENANDSDRKRIRRPSRSKTFKVVLSYAAKIPIQAIANAIRGEENQNTQEALRVLDIILRQHTAKQGCLLVRQSFFHNDPKNFASVGGGVLSCRGFHSSFIGTQAGLSLNMDVSTTMILKPGPVVDFLIANQNVKDPYSIDWGKAKRMLKNMRVKTATSNYEQKITGLSDGLCRELKFTLKKRGSNDKSGAVEETEMTVYDYYVNIRKIKLGYSADLPCINVGKPKRPTFIPLELCELVSLQRYTKALSNLQRASLVEQSRQNPQERMKTLSNALSVTNYDSDPMLGTCGVSISRDFVQIEGRVLPTPKLKVGNGEDLFPRDGRWNFNNKPIDPPFDIFEESPQFRRAPPIVRVEKIYEVIKSKVPDAPRFLLCLLPERKNSEIYGPWKKKNLAEFGIVTQCIAPTRVNDQYLTNVLLKINAKLGGLNSILSLERTPSMPLVSKVPTMILGMDVSHGSPGRSDVPSIAAVVNSRDWPLISRYRACVRTQSPKVEMIDNLFKRVSDTEDQGIVRELLRDFYRSSGNRKPEQIIIFRDGVAESQFSQVLNIELAQIIEACKFLDESWNPKFVLIVAQKKHHTKFFQPGSPQNVPPGTIIDSQVCHPRNNDFYLCAHAGRIGTTRPTHYHILHDEIGISADDMQELVHNLSYVYQKSTTAISVVSPICYAHLAAAQMGQWMKFEDTSETSSSHGGMTAPGAAPVPQLPVLNEKVSSSMFFC